MKICIVGSGNMWTKYNSACYLVDNNIMVDFPNGTCKYLYNLNITPNSIDHVLITHFHGDHYFDMPFYILNKSKSEGYIDIYCSKDGKNKIKKIGCLAFPNSFKKAFRKTKYTFANNFSIAEYEISKILLDHGRIKPAYGYIFQTTDNLVGFTGDTALCPNVEIMANTCNYLFCDCSLIEGNNKHLGIDNIVYLSSKYPNCQFITSHLGDDTRKKLGELNIKNIIIPKDGDIINID